MVTQLKTKWRDHYRRVRRELPPERREKGAARLLSLAQARLGEKGLVLSTLSRGSELSTERVNAWLLEQERLVLPRVHEGRLELYHVYSLEHLVQGPFDLLEPDPGEHPRILPERVAFALVPGLAFDHAGHRLGYGMGHFDRCLSQLPAECQIFGIAFAEQVHDGELPRELHDIPVHTLLSV